jgi:LmbE family N-acetylglucosaminyl deacetylase
MLSMHGVAGPGRIWHEAQMDERVARQAESAGGDALWRALQPLRSTATWLMFGAHPDDEWNGFLAWLVLGQGMRAVFACATRGDGGQNAIGPQRGADLAVLRSREMECAAREIGFGLRWLTPGGDDPICDFGFSRSASDTLARWGERRLIERMARAIREIRPNAVSPTFLDVPGQHGHHRAVTRSLAPALALAANPEWSCGLPPWQVEHAYLPAFSGGGGTYDDEVPPPPATVTVDLGVPCAVLGASWAQVGEWSRRYHASQGMGRWIEDGPRPLALHKWHGPPDRDVPLDDTPRDVAALAQHASAQRAARLIEDAAGGISAAIAGWPVRSEVTTALHRTVRALDRASEVLGEGEPARLLKRKRREAARAAAIARGMVPVLSITPNPLRPGMEAQVTAAGAAGAAVALRLPEGWRDIAGRILVPAGAATLGSMREGWDPTGGNDIVSATMSWEDAEIEVDPSTPVMIMPDKDVMVAPDQVVRRLGDPRPAVLRIDGTTPPPSWQAEPDGNARWRVRVPPGRTELGPIGAQLVPVNWPHVGTVGRVVSAAAVLLGADIVVDRAARVGVVAGETDRILAWLEQLGIDAVPLSDEALATGAFAGLTTVLVGMFAFRQRPALASARASLHAWVHDGGKLVTLYHRPADGWDPDVTPPRRIVIGAPSYRWRVTDPTAPVHVLCPESQALRAPNAISPGDWEGWVRERGLYFASDWDGAYRPLLEMADRGMAPLRGALLEAKIGRGWHLHVALALHHQLEALVPGAFRLLANLTARVTPL